MLWVLSRALLRGKADRNLRNRDGSRRSVIWAKSCDHRAIKRVVRPMLGFKSFRSAGAIIAGIETMHTIKKGQLEFAKTKPRLLLTSPTPWHFEAGRFEVTLTLPLQSRRSRPAFAFTHPSNPNSQIPMKGGSCCVVKRCFAASDGGNLNSSSWPCCGHSCTSRASALRPLPRYCRRSTLVGWANSGERPRNEGANWRSRPKANTGGAVSTARERRLPLVALGYAEHAAAPCGAALSRPRRFPVLTTAPERKRGKRAACHSPRRRRRRA